jgi:ketosteroid isomerase-like protein
MNPTQVAEAYFAAVRAKDVDAFVALFAPDADYIMPNGSAYKGTAQIREVQSGVFAHGSPVPTPLSMTASDTGIAVEVQARLPDGSSRFTANVYQLNDLGLIQRLSVYIKTG